MDDVVYIVPKGKKLLLLDIIKPTLDWHSHIILTYDIKVPIKVLKLLWFSSRFTLSDLSYDSHTISSSGRSENRLSLGE